MKLNYLISATITGMLAIVLFTTSTEAQSIFFGIDDYGRRTNPIGLKLLTMLIPICLGFCIGWFFSPGASRVRGATLIFSAVSIILVAIANDGVLGGSSALLVAVVGFFGALGFWLKRGISALGEAPRTFGSSRWATQEDLEIHNIIGDDGIRIGQAYHQAPTDVISYKGDRHLLTVAPTRSGKGTTQIIPNLLSYTGSTLVIDPKGENAMITTGHRKAMGQDVYIVDPWGIANIEGIETAHFNPLDWLDITDVDITENAMLLADALVVGENHADSFWIEEAKALLQGLILYVATDENEADQRHLGRVRDLLLLDGEDMPKQFKRMTQSPHHIVASTGARCLQKEPKLIANVLAAAQAQTHFLDSARIRESLSMSDFKFEDLKTKPMSIYLVLPADRLNAFGRWLRLLVQQAITVNARNIAKKPEKPILFILDEFAALGRLSMVEQAYGLMAGFGLQIWGIVQDFNQLERIYGGGWQSFVSNSGMINYFGSSDKMTAEYFSSMCGETTVWNFSSAVANAFSPSSGDKSTTETDNRSAAQRKLAYPDELMRINTTKQIVFIENMYPLQAFKTPWFKDEALKSKGVNLHDQ
ncbi:type IV secretory system conjugative DNA transfer family protein [Cohaesibacter gelatinilyticus]|uniref:Type IV secretion system protein VirD4 n=1 Tax=Cohaesibacter gelatinilyticus TaxID=372072 RepID=A0A285NDA0_9HYPH|nr:type IV secretory system conjugative DNA transfer family protein [Cohaesibacter gelatinilyticus]SNZ07409.1 type IV secretion system protein VirD4 [Cohaesibacter gelatinilyticus]